KPRHPRRQAGQSLMHIKPRAIVTFEPGRCDAVPDPVSTLGLKGAALHRLAKLGLPATRGIILTTEGLPRVGRLSDQLFDSIITALIPISSGVRERHGQAIYSVRCSPVVSTPGLMPAVLNIGVRTDDLLIIDEWSGNETLGADVLGRLIASFAGAVAGIPLAEFQNEVDAAMAETVPSPTLLADLVQRFKRLWEDHTGEPWPEDPGSQLRRAVDAALASWNSPVAAAYRRKNNLPDERRLAVIIQLMAFGNYSQDSAVASLSTRNPATGRNTVTGDFAPAIQGNAYEAGNHGPIARFQKFNPVAFTRILKLKTTLEHHYRDAVDIDLVVERDAVHILNCRPARCTPVAAARIACDMVREKLIDKADALLRVDPESLTQLLHPRIDPAADKTEIATGSAASPGAASGKLAFSAEEALARAGEGEPIILARVETEASDVAAMSVCEGILTTSGGMTSHAAVVARTMALPCIVGAAGLTIDPDRQTLTTPVSQTFGPGDWVTLDGAAGAVYAGQLPTIEPELPKPFRTLLTWADEYRTLDVRANADTPRDAEIARAFGADGIGLCRTEHMFFDPRRIIHMRRMILADTAESRAAALGRLLPLQRDDFIGIFTAMAGLPVTIRLLDPPLHEFLPRSESDQQALAVEMGLTLEQIRHRVEQLHESNPMLGHRGCRLCITYPEILTMQVRAILEAACACRQHRIKVEPEIMIPLVCDRRELDYLRTITMETAEAVFTEQQTRVDFRFGTMIEVPRAALLAGSLAESAEFFSFGTNDLTQMTLGLSRDDASRFLPDYLAKGIFTRDPFQTLDTSGVGQLIHHAVELGRRAHPALKCGLCGEHGGDAQSIRFCHDADLDYVSASPWRIPLGRLAAAQAAIIGKRGG
ncbi:MAG: pyruvate, phosphate dikinase, partial [Tepidisphaeraceae bacterium]